MSPRAPLVVLCKDSRNFQSINTIFSKLKVLLENINNMRLCNFVFYVAGSLCNFAENALVML